MTFLDVGQGDAAVIEVPNGRVVVIDGGGNPGTDERWGSDPGTRAVVPYLRSRGISTVDLLIPTHPDEDHLQGLVAVTKRLRVQSVLTCGYTGDSALEQRFRESLRARGVVRYQARRGQLIPLGKGAVLTVLNPPETVVPGAHSETNNRSIVVRLTYGEASFLFTGDAETEAEADMVRTVGEKLQADVLKVGHHGSRWSTTEEFLRAVHPKVAVVSCGEENRYGHPTPEVLGRLAQEKVRVFRTDRQGGIVVETDGERLRVVPTLEPR